ncbi:uncharacterized protein LOC110029835 [Phalaenopsis equestris]|uniref:uncharacterized protein LOC110029835 n=1 Tax=Phalaenopsis equestris TaxID=78828 RepID=UPI0009E1D4E0|nr:uncharacterized protein LOC110029835 [Phalaenopsis equestris]
MSTEDRRSYHPALDGVMKLLSKANRDLSLVQLHIEGEFRSTYPDNANPCKLICRMKRIQEDLVSLKDLCQELLKEKQDLMDQIRASLSAQRSSLNRLLSSSGLPHKTDSDDAAYTNLNQIIDEWKLQLKSKTGDEKDLDKDINLMLFSAIVNNN